MRKINPSYRGMMVFSILLFLFSACGDLGASTLPATQHPPTIEIATSTPQPTPTITPTINPIIAARDFMDPLLKSVADRHPDYQDDFSNKDSGWPIGEHPHSGSGFEEGITGYEDGEYFIIASEAKFPQDEFQGKLITCQTASNPLAPLVLDFVINIDVRFATKDNDDIGIWLINFWQETKHHFGVYGSRRFGIGLKTNYPLDGFLQPGMLAGTLDVPSFDRNGGWNHVVVVAKKSTLAISLNNQVVIYLENFPPHLRGPVILAVCNNGWMPSRMQWDNLKIWHLSE